MSKLVELSGKFGGVLLGVAALIIVVLMSGVTSCSSEREPVQGSIDRTGQPIVVTTYFYDNVREVQAMYAQVHDVPRRDIPDGLQGFARWPEWTQAEPENAVYECEIHTVRPQRVDDRHTLTLGHELLHCIIGTYHQ